MKTILITGLDGSGKSTLLSRLVQGKTDLSYEFIFAPHINTDGLEQEPKVLEAALFINNLNAEADQRGLPPLKAIALFASMLLFKKLWMLQQKKMPQTIFCERHPLIDTGVYARFYAAKLHPESIDTKVLHDLDQRFSNPLEYLLTSLPKEYQMPIGNLKATTFLTFIYQWFYVENKYSIDDLKALFGLPLPDRIYFLDASPQTLYQRIQHRSVKEAHESPEVFEKLRGVYLSLFEDLKNQLYFESINANDPKELDLVFEKIYQQQKA